MSFISDLLTNITAFRITIGDKLNTLKNAIGNLPSLSTNHKTDLVGAINEVNGKADNLKLTTWTSVLKYNTWSRLLYSDTSASAVSGLSYILNVKSTRGGFVVNFTFLITCTHAGGANAGNITQLSGNKYSNFKIRIVSNGYSSHTVEILDEYNNGDTYFNYICTLTKSDENLIFSPKTVFEDGTILSGGYHVDKEFQTVYRGVVSEMFATQNYGSAEDWWNASQQVGNKANADGSNITNIGNWQSQLGISSNVLNPTLQSVMNKGNISTLPLDLMGLYLTGNTFYHDSVFYFRDRTNGFLQNVNIADATANNHAVNLGQLNTKVDVMENAIGVGFSNGSFNALPYIYHTTGGYKFLATIEYINAQDYASVTYVNQQLNNIPLHYVYAINGNDANTPRNFDNEIDKTYVGSVIDQVDGLYYNIINIRHRNGVGDGNSYGGQIRFGMTGRTDQIEFRNHYNGNWSNWYILATSSWVSQQIASIPVHNGQLTVNTTADLVGGYTYLPSGNVTTTLGLATHILNAIADGQAAYNIIQNSNFAPNNGYDYIPTGGSQTIQPTATKTTVAIQGANVTITLLDGVNDGDECSITTCGGQQYYVDGTIIDKCGNQLHEAQTSTLWWWHQKDNVWYQAI